MKKFLALMMVLCMPVALAVDPQAKRVQTDTTNFTGHLSSNDTDVQKALDTLDDLSVTETDPVFLASDAASVTSTDITSLSNLSGTNTGDRNLRTVTFTFDGNYAPPTVATIASAVMGYDGSFTGWKIIEANGTSSSIVLTIKKNGAAVSGTEKPTLASQTTNSDTSLTTWTTSFSKGDVITAYVDSASTGIKYVCAIYAEATS